MELTRYVDELRHQLLVAAEAGGDDARALAERLVSPLQASTRLVLLDALTAAAGEITSDLAPGSVEVRLRGTEPEFVVTPPPSDEPEVEPDLVTGAAPVVPAAVDDDGGTARVTLRIPETLKLRIDDAAALDGLSVNAWLVRTLNAAIEPSAPDRRPVRRSNVGGESYTGWTTA